MFETRREPVPRVDTDELEVAHAFLAFQRHCVLKKAEGLTDEQLRRPVVASGTSILGLVQHLAEAERGCFGHHLGGADRAEEDELGMTVPAGRTAGQVIAEYRAAIEASDRAITAAGDPGRRHAQVVALDPRPHDHRGRPARRSRGHHPGADRRRHRALKINC